MQNFSQQNDRQQLIDNFDKNIEKYLAEIGCTFGSEDEQEAFVVSLAIDELYSRKLGTYKKVKRPAKEERTRPGLVEITPD